MTQRGQGNYTIVVQPSGDAVVGEGGRPGLPIVKVFLNVATVGCEEVELGQFIVPTVCPSALQLLQVLRAEPSSLDIVPPPQLRLPMSGYL